MSHPLPNLRDLSVSERIQLVEDIWDSLAEENPQALQLTPMQRAEVRKRLVAHEQQPDSAQPWEAIRESLFKQEH